MKITGTPLHIYIFPSIRKGCSRKKDMGEEDGNPYSNMRVIEYGIFEIPWVVVNPLVMNGLSHHYHWMSQLSFLGALD